MSRGRPPGERGMVRPRQHRRRRLRLANPPARRRACTLRDVSLVLAPGRAGRARRAVGIGRSRCSTCCAGRAGDGAALDRQPGRRRRTGCPGAGWRSSQALGLLDDLTGETSCCGRLPTAGRRRGGRLMDCSASRTRPAATQADLARRAAALARPGRCCSPDACRPTSRRRADSAWTDDLRLVPRRCATAAPASSPPHPEAGVRRPRGPCTTATWRGRTTRSTSRG